MKRMRIAYTVVLCLLFGALAYARPQQEEEPKPHEKASAPSQQKPEAKPEGPERPGNAKPEKSDKEAAPDRRSEQQSEKEKETSPASKSAKEPANGQSNASGHARPAGKSAHIPDEKFRANFGREHKFSIGKPNMVNNQPAFVYGGYTFEIIDAWPVEWAYTDDVYIDYIDGDYFLFDLLHPGMRIALFVVM